MSVGGWVLLLLPRILELSSLSNGEAELETPRINGGLGERIRHGPEEGMGPVRSATRLIAYPTQSCTSVTVC